MRQTSLESFIYEEVKWEDLKYKFDPQKYKSQHYRRIRPFYEKICFDFEFLRNTNLLVYRAFYRNYYANQTSFSYAQNFQTKKTKFVVNKNPYFSNVSFVKQFNFFLLNYFFSPNDPNNNFVLNPFSFKRKRRFDQIRLVECKYLPKNKVIALIFKCKVYLVNLLKGTLHFTVCDINYETRLWHYDLLKTETFVHEVETPNPLETRLWISLQNVKQICVFVVSGQGKKSYKFSKLEKRCEIEDS